MIPRQSPCCRREAIRALGALAAGAALPGWLTACDRRSSAPVPPEIALDQDACEWCRMTIDDARLVAAYVPVSGRALAFGEPGCLLAWIAEHPDAEGAAFVAAQEAGGWLPAPSAIFARGMVRTPMRFDLAAWREKSEGVGGDGRTWSQLLGEGKPHARRD